MASLRTNYKDDILSGDRKYRMITNSDGTVSFIDVTDYTQEGDTFGALDINATNTAVNALQEANGDTDISGIGDGTNTGAISAINTHLNDLTKRVATVTTTTATTWRTILTTLASQINISNFNNKHAHLVVKIGTSYVYWTLERVDGGTSLDFINTECSSVSTKIIKLSVGANVARVLNEINSNGWYTFDQLDNTVQTGVEISIYMGA